MKKPLRLLCLAASLAVIGQALPVIAQENLKYQTPPKEILDLADVVRAPSVQIDSKWITCC